MARMQGEPAHPFPALRALLDAYFHQDFDLDGDVEEIMARYRAEAPPAERRRLKQDIARFLHRHREDADEAFARILRPAVDPGGWGMTALDWLRWIERLG